MRLNSIKLSGFKSFAEPTHFQLPGQLVGVVGPNGCGKSNIMDAVRWVLGESKASELRGESMQDVIFNGSANRKPASRSSVELVFRQLTTHRAGGQWGQFAEMAVERRAHARRHLAATSSTTSRCAAATCRTCSWAPAWGRAPTPSSARAPSAGSSKSAPEELRLFLEEAAGVSKYKERRRETENRLEDTRENLTRVEDILRELNANLDKLEKQAEVAAQYNALNADAHAQAAPAVVLEAPRCGHGRDPHSACSGRGDQCAGGPPGRTARRGGRNWSRCRQDPLCRQRRAASGARGAGRGESGGEPTGRAYPLTWWRAARRSNNAWPSLKGQNEQWLERRSAAEFELEELAEKMLAAEEQAEILAAQLEELAGNLPEL